MFRFSLETKSCGLSGRLQSTGKSDLFKDPKMLQRFQDIVGLPDKERECILTTVDNFIKAAKINLI